MIEPSLELQAAIRDRLIAHNPLTALVSPTSIRDGLPAGVFPTISFQGSQTVLESITYSRKHVRVFQDLHVFTKETGSVAVKLIVAAMMNALAIAPAVPGLLDFQVDSARYLRDPGDIGHAVVTVSALVERVE